MLFVNEINEDVMERQVINDWEMWRRLSVQNDDEETKSCYVQIKGR
jgi:hypothetical protein